VPDLPFSGSATKMVALLQMNERYIRWYTPWLSREFEMLAFENGGGLPLIIFPTSFGRYYQNKDFGLVGSVSAFADAGRVTVYCPDAIDFNSPYEYLPNMPDPWKFNHMGITLGTGELDNARDQSHRLSGILNSKGIKHWLDDGKWRGHDWNYWRDMLPYYLSVL
jgi:esterase/lipase superfamily enzyme